MTTKLASAFDEDAKPAEPKPMDGQELEDCLAAIGWSNGTAQEKLGIRNRSSIQRMLSGANRIYPDVAAWFRKLRDFHDANPPPKFRLSDPE